MNLTALVQEYFIRGRFLTGKKAGFEGFSSFILVFPLVTIVLGVWDYFIRVQGPSFSLG